MSYRHFQRGQEPVFNCAICGRRTRNTTGSDSGLCGQCWDLAGWDNHHNDNGEAPTPSEMQEYEALLRQAVRKGGDETKIRRNFDYIWSRPEGDAR